MRFPIHFFCSTVLMFSLGLLRYYRILPQLLQSSTSAKTAMEEFCNKHQENVTFYKGLIIQSSKLNTLVCLAPKTGTTNLIRIFHASLFNTNHSVQENAKWMHQFDRFDVWSKLYPTLENFTVINTPKTLSNLITEKRLFKFLFVRQPLRRIYSVYHDKFNNTSRDSKSTYWVDMRRLILKQMNKSNDDLLDFRTFLQYIVHSISHGFELDNHFDSIYKLCGICSIKYDFVGKVENMEYDGPKILDQLRISHRLTFPSRQLDDREGITMTDDDILQVFRNTLKNENHVQILIEYFLKDFQAFNYPVPSIIKRLTTTPHCSTASLIPF
ncbi:unnamed protein product [Adineta ricciae]|uniref:Carbohydrate sulfotransferase n=1 Tax=Adineta ricciae TaxID=249248 RepID=A0A814Z3M5_ADIRI|nr:unnamed protein product [Adineta ricciae]CAF1524475.1 unnamed protein product [Adineta ricciae]